MNYTHFKKLVKSKARRNSEAKHFVDKLLALGEALGCMPVQCPEQGAWGYRDLDLDRMIHEIQQRLPMEVSPPKAGGGSFGLNTDFGTLCMKDIIAIYTAFRVHSLLAGARQKIVAEIGGGTGTLAYYLAKAGMDEVSVFDLPIISILQAYYLMKSLGPDQVWLYGEAIRPAAARLMPYWQFNNAPKDYFSLIANQDSLPEIEVSAAENYIQLIREKGNEFFLSLNQEAHAPNAGGVEQSIVYNLVEKNGGFERIYRFPHWMRAGYVEELYRIR